ncbi:MAG: SIMPL domain-containing protein [Phormidesmis sp. RL_2_1]|nr:SIMPL domain-containing protein [Phormidesmis sp. RL_2_1]
MSQLQITPARTGRWGLFFVLAALTVVPSYGLLTQAAAVAQPMYQQRERVLNVTGQATETIPTTIAQVNLGVVVEASTAQAAQQQAAQQSTAVIEWLNSQTVEKLETTGISLNPRYDYTDNRQVLIGYEASNTVSFRAPTERAGAIMDGAVEAGATQINGVSFVAEDGAIASARQRALASAVRDAQAQADTVLAALGLTRQEVINITIGGLSAPPPNAVAPQAARIAEADFAKTPIIGQEQTINAQVTLDIRY